MSLTTLSLMAGAIGSFPPTSGPSVALALRSHNETRAAALKAEVPQEHGVRWIDGRCPNDPYCNCGYERAYLPRDSKRVARRARMAAKRRRGW